ncbi:hypothetical protein [Halomicrobium salinisoli]|uniref:hypothetical protein n=1 Tax=Halomicrobium salinisoli TaxID=2878391 RepID=UPI001CF0BF4A|nr:hypothetical protein [Halomicrobium salinisoli]
MGDDVPDAEAATEIAEAYADEECIGQLGDVVAVEDRESEWLVEFRTHTFTDAYTHTVRITKAVGNVVGHERST